MVTDTDRRRACIHALRPAQPNGTIGGVAAHRRLTRSPNGMIFGVCAGIAEYYGWDVTLFRIVYVIGSILSAAFPGTVVYIILALVMPRPEPRATRQVR
jgi:phage shock protein PspC (stress-responsive transcriptional regulator)